MNRIKKTDIRSLVSVALMSALISVTSFLTIPFPIPITLQTFGVYFALFTLGGKSGTLSVLLYICIGAVGLPVFSGFTGGVSRLFDATGGYIFGFLVLSVLYWILSKILPKSCISDVICSGVSLFSLYLTGVIWYALIYLDGTKNLGYVISVGVLPFIFPDILKISLAYFIARKLSVIAKIKY